MPRGRVNWEKINSMTEEEIEANAVSDPDAPTITDEMWDLAYFTLPSGENKDQMTLRLDREVTDYFRKTGKGFQSRMNAVLRNYVERQKRQQA
jgi:uncharacterized protein (DUF4415 family)